MVIINIKKILKEINISRKNMKTTINIKYLLYKVNGNYVKTIRNIKMLKIKLVKNM